MDTTPVVVETTKKEVVHYCDYQWDGQLHLSCKRPWAHHKWTEKEMQARGIFNSDYGLYTEDKSKVTCDACKESQNKPGDN
jgi:hypothetical protein